MNARRIDPRLRKRSVRPVTITLSMRQVAVGRALWPASNVERPHTRSECVDGPRPCPFVSCRYHLYLNVLATGRLQMTFPDLEPWELEESCALDVAEFGGVSLQRAGELNNITKQRVMQILNSLKKRVRTAFPVLSEHISDGRGVSR